LRIEGHFDFLCLGLHLYSLTFYLQATLLTTIYQVELIALSFQFVVWEFQQAYFGSRVAIQRLYFG
jgi:hypothetical protein